jgi:hypothetical protein
MRAALLLLLAPLAVSAAETRLTDPTARYSAMLEQSPFALATVVEAPEEPKESFAANWELTSLARLRDEHGEEKDYVTIRSRDRRLSFTLLGDQEATEEEAKGVSIQSVDRQDGRKSSVILKRGAETAKVEFSQEASAPPAVPGNPAAMNANQTRVLQMQQMQTQQAQQARMQQMQNTLTYGANKIPGAQPAAGIPRPAPNGAMPPNMNPVPNSVNTAVPPNAFGGMKGNLPNNGVVYPQPNNPNLNPALPNSADPRRRLRVINTRQ